MTTTNEEEVPTFEPSAMDLPTRKQMLAAIRCGLRGILFQVQHLSEYDDSSHDEPGGIDVYAPEVADALEEAAWLVKMYDALRLPEKSERSDSGPRAA